MSLRGRIFCMLFAFMYLGTLNTYDVDAARGSERSGKKSKKKGKSKSSKRNRGRSSTPVSVAQPAASTASATEAETTTTTQATTQQAQTVATPEQSANNTTTNASATAEVEKIDVPNDAEWDGFRVCMQQSCGGGDEQPANVQCYKSVNFDNAFLNCKLLVAEGKRKQFEEYFKGDFIQKEQAEFCAETYKGTWKNGKCALTVSYKRPRVKNECLSDCGAVTKTKEWIVDGRNYICSGDDFGVGVCYRDNPNCQAAKIEKVTGYIALGSAALTTTLGVVQGISSAKVSLSHKETDPNAVKAKNEIEKQNEGKADKDKIDTSNIITTKDVWSDYSSTSSLMGMESTDKNGNTIKIDEKNYKESRAYKDLKKEQIFGGITGGIAAGSGQITSAATNLVAASMHSKEKGDVVYGNCNLPNGEVISEGAAYKLSW